MVDIKNDYFDKGGLVYDMVDEIILSMMVMKMTCWMMTWQLSQQSEANYRTKYNYKLSTQLDTKLKTWISTFFNMSTFTYSPQRTFSIFPIPHTKILPSSTSTIFQCSKQCYSCSSTLQHSQLLSNFNALHTFPKQFHIRTLLTISAIFNAMSMLPQQFYVTMLLYLPLFSSKE